MFYPITDTLVSFVEIVYICCVFYSEESIDLSKINNVWDLNTQKVFFMIWCPYAIIIILLSMILIIEISCCELCNDIIESDWDDNTILSYLIEKICVLNIIIYIYILLFVNITEYLFIRLLVCEFYHNIHHLLYLIN